MEHAKVTSALWGLFDQYIVTGHADGTVAKYDLLKVSQSINAPYLNEPFTYFKKFLVVIIYYSTIC